MTIRPARESDFGAISQIYALSKLDELRYESQAFNLLHLVDDEKRYSIFKQSDVYIYEGLRIKGFGAVQKNCVTFLYVHPEERSKGVGKSIFSHLLNQISGEAMLFIAKSNVPAKNFYEQFGFKIVSDFMTSYNGGDVIASKMVRRAPIND